MVGVGLSQNTDTRLAVREAVERAHFTGRPAWIIAMSARRHDPHAVLAAIRDIFPGVPVYGGSCVGAIGADRIGYSGQEIALALFGAGFGMPEVRVAAPLGGAEHERGAELGEWLAASPSGGALLFYDVVRGEGINIGSRLLDGIYARLPAGRGAPVFGAGLIADFQVTGSWLFDGEGVRRDAAVMLRLPETLEISTRVMHGCTPASALMTVTRAEGARVHELDGVRALDALRGFAGAGKDDDLALAFSVLLGRRAGDPFSAFDEVDYINRLIIGVDAADGSVSLFEEDIRSGDRVQVMVRNNTLLMESVADGVRAALADTAGGERLFGLYIDCAGRASVFTGSQSEESELLLQGIGDAFPLLGFYVGREIAPFGGRSRPLDWTGVLAIFSRRRARDEEPA